jgi:hypothetical protein
VLSAGYGFGRPVIRQHLHGRTQLDRHLEVGRMYDGIVVSFRMHMPVRLILIWF